MYHTYVASKSYVWAARAYLLHLVGNTILANKSLTHVHICYLHYLSDLDCCNEYTWGATTLAFLYDQQSYASKYGNQQMRGRKHPLAPLWFMLSATGKVVATREFLDRLQMVDVFWSPYASRRDIRPFEDFGYIKVGTNMWSYLSERVLR
ncbi:Protein MAINTENANCE OF MERISTEMS [Glycine max]|nr:Protein MAINTENANCE OF MERISTEMS [Glycine max]